MPDNILQKSGSCRLASRKSDLVSTVSHIRLITFIDLLHVHLFVYASVLFRVRAFIIAQHTHEGNICQSAEFTCHKPTSKATSALLDTRYNVLYVK